MREREKKAISDRKKRTCQRNSFIYGCDTVLSKQQKIPNDSIYCPGGNLLFTAGNRKKKSTLHSGARRRDSNKENITHKWE